MDSAAPSSSYYRLRRADARRLWRAMVDLVSMDTGAVPYSDVDYVGGGGDAQPFRARPGRKGVQPYCPRDQLACRCLRDRPSRTAWVAEQLDYLLLAQA